MGIPGVLSTEDSGPAIGASSVAQGAQANSDVVKSGIQAATMQEQIQKQQQDVEQQKTEIANAKFGKITDMMDRITREPNLTARKNLATALNTTAQQLGMGTLSPMAIDQVVNDDETRNQYRQLINNPQFAKVFKDPRAQQDYMQALFNQFGPKEGLAQANKMLDQHHKEVEEGLESQKIGAIRQKEAAKGPTLTVGQEAADKNFAKDYQDWNAQGGYAAVDKQLNQLEESANILEKDPDLVGGITSALPDQVRKRLNSKAFNVEQMVKQAVQGSLKATLGAQFTEQEGKKVEDRSFDAALPAKENIARIRATVKELRARADEKNKAAKYFEDNNGSLAGYRPANSRNGSQLSGGSSQQSSSNISPDKIKLALQHYTPEQVEAKIGRKLTAQEKALVGSK